jgi:hypothetical protein
VENPWNLFSGCSAPSHIINLPNVIAFHRDGASTHVRITSPT